MITPWNWPINQIACKVAPALAAGCTMVLKPSEIAPMNAMLFAEVMDEAGVPPGVFNLVNGDGPTVGEAMSAASGHRHDVVHRLDARRHRGGQGLRRHGQARGAGTGRQVREHRARGRRPDQGGGRRRHERCSSNSGQSCNAPSRMFVPRSQAGRSHGHRQGDGREGQGRRPLRRRHDHGPGRQRSAVQQDPGPDRKGHRGRCDRWCAAARAVPKASTAATTCARRCSRTSPTT